MDTLGEITTICALAILGVAGLLSLLVREIGYPKWLVRHFAELKHDEYRQVLTQVVREQRSLQDASKLELRQAIEEAGRYEQPADRVEHLVKATLQKPVDGHNTRFASEVPFFVDFMSGSTDPKFASECGFILASFLRLQRSDLQFDYIVGLKNGSPLIAAALATQLNCPLILHRGVRGRKKRDSPDLKSYEEFDGDYSLLPGRALIVDDSTTGGTMIIDCANSIRKCDGTLTGAVVLFEVVGRNGHQSMSRNGIPFFPVVRIDRSYVNALNS